MSILFACEGCGKRYEVDDSRAGRRGKCSACGRGMTVPDATPAVPAEIEADEVYGLIEAPEPEPSTFVAALGRTSTAPSGPRGPGLRGVARKDRQDRSVPVRTLAIGGGIAVVVLIILAAALPRGTMIVGGVLAGFGALLAMYAYVIGAYMAFSEDSLYCFLYLLIPLYTAYYLISRWDDMRWHLAVGAIGLGLAVVGGGMLEAGGVAANPPEAEAAILAPRPARLPSLS